MQRLRGLKEKMRKDSENIAYLPGPGATKSNEDFVTLDERPLGISTSESANKETLDVRLGIRWYSHGRKDGSIRHEQTCLQDGKQVNSFYRAKDLKALRLVARAISFKSGPHWHWRKRYHWQYPTGTDRVPMLAEPLSDSESMGHYWPILSLIGDKHLSDLKALSEPCTLAGASVSHVQNVPNPQRFFKHKESTANCIPDSDMLEQRNRGTPVVSHFTGSDSADNTGRFSEDEVQVTTSELEAEELTTTNTRIFADKCTRIADLYDIVSE